MNVTPLPLPESARERRRQAKLAAQFHQWWSGVPDSDRLPFYKLATLARLTGADPIPLAQMLRTEGWQRGQRRICGVAVSVWAPPDQPSPVRPTGRPPTTHNRKHPTP